MTPRLCRTDTGDKPYPEMGSKVVLLGPRRRRAKRPSIQWLSALMTVTKNLLLPPELLKYLFLTVFDTHHPILKLTICDRNIYLPPFLIRPPLGFKWSINPLGIMLYPLAFALCPATQRFHPHPKVFDKRGFPDIMTL